MARSSGEKMSRKRLTTRSALEAVAEIALGTMLLNADAPGLEQYMLEKHYMRKHGGDAYYGQK